ncbi:SDR family NAD(P)-dependent oxidoreductase [Actinomadura macra]|uniref:SDR family NAD(P)-dependent oxidoreductase n=1 Tax=Actinomadura macra TaxID=46164 RepID=UPI00082E3A32|nr:SDR family oxidoreductase [Actinomadura macra]
MRTIVISGASRGIGQATAERFRRAGDHVYNLDVRPPEGRAEGIMWLEADVADWTAVEAAFAIVHRERERIDVAIANAGISVPHGVLELTETDARRVIDVNLLGVLGMWRCAARSMMSASGGVLLATGSINGHRGFPYYADYNAAKAGIAALCRTFALELSPTVRAACVTPGAVLTPMQLAEYTPEMLADIDARIPSRRHAAPEEIADAFFYLASPEARYMTGQELVLDGGEIAGGTTSDHGTGGTGRAESPPAGTARRDPRGRLDPSLR